MFNSVPNSEILIALDDYVHGHTTAKKILINLINRSKVSYYKRMVLKDGSELPQLNCFLIGKSGTGKTLLVEALQKICHFPLFKLDATSLNPSGSNGGNTMKEVAKNIRTFATNFQKENSGTYFSVDGVLNQTIVFVDEMDKLSNNDYSEGWNQHVQANFLRFFENKEEGLNGLSFIFAGAFMKMDRDSNKTSSIGFFNNPISSKKKELDEAIIKMGMLPEIIGRIHHIIELDSLTEDDYRAILVDKIIPAKQLDLYEMTHNELEICPNYIDEIIKEAYNSDQGVRYLNKKIEEYLIDFEFSNNVHNSL